MANTYTQLYVQIVFSVKHREACISPIHREELHRYITTIITNEGYKLLAIFCMPDHIHILIGLNPETSISELVRKVKTESSKFINRKNWRKGKFNWQTGYGAFSYSRSHLPEVISYIQNQEQHHQKKNFQQEYRQFLERFEVDYEEQYLFDLN